MKSLSIEVNQPVSLLEEIESINSLPWSVAPSVMADLAILFRLHIAAIEELSDNSYQIALFSEQLSINDDADVLKLKHWLSEVRRELRRRGATELLS